MDPTPYGGSTMAKSKALLGSCRMYSMQSQFRISMEGVFILRDGRGDDGAVGKGLVAGFEEGHEVLGAEMIGGAEGDVH